MSSCFIQLDNYESQYSPGSFVTGRVICSFTSSKNIRGIVVRLKGEEHNEWRNTESYYDEHEKRHRTRYVQYIGHNTFLHIENTLMGAGDIGPGRFEYPFSLQLPTNLPSTYDGRHGGVFFSVESKVDKPFQLDYTDSKRIVVISPINFNNMKDQLQLEPVSYSDDKTLCCFCCASGPITMEVHLEKEAYVPGELMKVKIEITNMSNESIEAVQLELGMKIKSKVTSPSHESKSDYELLATNSDTGVGAHGERTYNLGLEIPPSAVVPNFNLCELFKESTRLKVTAVLPDCHQDMDIEAYITMGHIPIYSDSQNGPADPYPPNAYPPSPYTPTSYPPSMAAPPLPYPPNVAAPPLPYPPSMAAPTSSYPPNPYPPAPYPPGETAPPYPPVQEKAGPGPIGFTVPQEAEPGPSAPPPEGVASAPSKQEVAEGEFVVVGQEGNSRNEPPPPSYNEAVFNPTKQ